MSVPVLIISGFLGCGKTSFLRHLLPLCGEAGARPALIINEVGDVDVDGELLADLHAARSLLVGGCVCCTLQAQLATTVQEVLDQQAGDMIIIECSGLSNPLDVVGVLSAPALLPRVAVSHVICLLDARRGPLLLKAAELAVAQVKTADVLIFNKADTIAEADRPGVEAAVSALAPAAEKHWACYGDIGTERLRRLLTDPAPVKMGTDPIFRKASKKRVCPHFHDEHSHNLPASFWTTAVPLPAEMERPALERLLADLPPEVLRAKGFANLAGEGWQAIQRVYEHAEIIPFADTPAGGPILVCIGQHINAEDVEAQVREALGT
ncbi:MAG: CobW family GTP-binding protein [Armatimonadota bacterium]